MDALGVVRLKAIKNHNLLKDMQKQQRDVLRGQERAVGKYLRATNKALFQHLLKQANLLRKPAAAKGV